MNGHDVAMRRMMGSDAFNVWTKQFTRGFLRCDIVDLFDKLSEEILLRDLIWHERFRELQKIDIGTQLTIRIPQRLRR